MIKCSKEDESRSIRRRNDYRKPVGFVGTMGPEKGEKNTS